MALCDYILCSKCECKLIYDGNGTQREWWEDRWNQPPIIQCPDCAASVPAVPQDAPTRFYIDTEFNEFRGELISIALVGEDGQEFYEVLPAPAEGYGPWVAQHVVPILNKPPITKPELQAKLAAFLRPYKAAHLVADWPEDIEHFLHLLITGPGERIGPDRWTMEVRRDLPNTADVSAIPHNALEDARALCKAAMLSASPAAPAPTLDVEKERRDAERYRWLRDGNKRWDGQRSNDEHLYGEELDAAIDAAMRQEGEKK